VAAHLEAEILFVDEVLAVGDAAFQEKCLRRMGEAARSGRTVLFVSHNMAAITVLCKRAIWIEEGSIFQDGPASRVVQSYLSRGKASSSRKAWAEDERPGNQWFRLISVTLRDKARMPTSQVNISEEATVEIEYEVIQKGARAQFSLVLFDAAGQCVFGSLSNAERNFHGKPLTLGRYLSRCTLYGNLLNDGRYHFSITGGSDYWADSFRLDHILSFEAVDDGVLKGDYSGTYDGVIRPKLTWETLAIGNQADRVGYPHER